MKVHLSSTAFNGRDRTEKWLCCREKASGYGWEAGVQIHNSEKEETVRFLAEQGIPLSVHGPLLQKKNWNLAVKDPSDVFEAIEENVDLFRSLGVRECVFHGGLMADISPEAFGHGKSYRECMSALFRKELCLLPEQGFNRDFTAMEEYKERFAFLKRNLAAMRERWRDITFCLENDFPAYGSMNMFFRDMTGLGTALCLDTGHLWISCHLMNRDFHKEVECAASSGLVKMCHFHESLCKKALVREQWTDGHKNLSVRNEELDLKRVLHTLQRGGCELFVFEFADCNVEDMEIFHSYLDEAE